MDQGAWRATVHAVAKSQDTTEQLTLFSLFHDNSKLVSQLAALLYFPTSAVSWFQFLHILINSYYYYYYYHHTGHEVVPHGGFDLHIPKKQ